MGAGGGPVPVFRLGKCRHIEAVMARMKEMGVRARPRFETDGFTEIVVALECEDCLKSFGIHKTTHHPASDEPRDPPPFRAGPR